MGSRPLVHVGFLKSWLAGGLNEQVIKQVTEAVKQCQGQTGSSGEVVVYVTGGCVLQPSLQGPQLCSCTMHSV